jgi:S-adenosylmethionine hydrolase
VNPAAQIVDISHGGHSFDVLDGALSIAQAYSFFPAGAIHCVVVDPGVGTARRPIVVETAQYLFLAPDNGVLSFIYDREERVVVRHITADHYFRRPVSATFHGRDIFAPVAGFLSRGTSASVLGGVIENYVHFAISRPQPDGEGKLSGIVLKVDKFGNLVTNIRPEDVPEFLQSPAPEFRIVVGNTEIRSLRTAFAEGAAGEVFAILGSTGLLEIATNRGSAARILNVGRGAEVRLELDGGQRSEGGSNEPEDKDTSN